DSARARVESARAAAAAARATLAAAELAESEARGPLDDAEREWQRLSAEAKALGEVLRPEGPDLFPPLIDAVKVRQGYEAALAAALGDDLQAPLDEASPYHWRDLGPVDAVAPLPAGSKSLGEFVRAPAALARRLALTGVVFPDQGKALQGALKPGQRLVSPRGDLWRWDGFSASADAPSAAAIRLSQRNRLLALDGEIEAAREVRAAAFAIYSAAREAAAAARLATRAAEQDERDTDQSLIAAQDGSTKAARAAAERASQLASLEAEIR